mmetsp:Transcript_2081/g.4142  ORF Transcript_2081/g.4142 Transcript_2081/m.4142 type:complete len:203 (+) Transcript_2081:1768-2376(+)
MSWAIIPFTYAKPFSRGSNPPILLVPSILSIPPTRLMLPLTPMELFAMNCSIPVILPGESDILSPRRMPGENGRCIEPLGVKGSELFPREMLFLTSLSIMESPLMPNIPSFIGFVIPLLRCLDAMNCEKVGRDIPKGLGLGNVIKSDMLAFDFGELMKLLRSGLVNLLLPLSMPTLLMVSEVPSAKLNLPSLLPSLVSAIML